MFQFVIRPRPVRPFVYLALRVLALAASWSVDATAAAFNRVDTREPLGLQAEWRVAVGDQ